MIDTRHQKTSFLPLIARERKRRAGLDAAIAAAERIVAGTVVAHQVAVNSLVELAISTPDFCKKFPNTEPTIPFEQVPAFFRLAIEEAKAGSPSQHRDETAILECALMLIEQNGGDANIRTAEQEEFYADVLVRRENEEFHVSYSPSNVTVN